MALDVMPGGPELALFADAAAGAHDCFAGASDDELTGVLRAWDRLEAHVAARKLAAVAELIRRRPEPGGEPEGPARMPAAWEEFTADELAQALAESRGRADDMLDPGTAADGPAARDQGGAAGRDHHQVQGGDHRLGDRAAGSGRGPGGGGAGPGPGGAADAGRAAGRDRPRGDGGRAGEGAQAAGGGGAGRAGAAVGRGLRERRADGP